MNTKKEKWISEVMESIDGAGRATLRPEVKNRILQQARSPIPARELQGFRMIWKIAAAVLFLVTLNIFTLLFLQGTSGNTETRLKSTATEYFSYIDNPYNL
jgi:hypothetical protein